MANITEITIVYPSSHARNKFKEEKLTECSSAAVMEKAGEMLSNSHGSRRTRSQVAPDWTVQDSLILVNEIGAVEIECKNTFASFQKWTIVAQNCSSLIPNRSLDQVRRRWESLLVDYRKIKQYQEEKSESYWSMIEERRKELSLPESFDLELFKEVSRVLPIVEGRAGTDHGTDPDLDHDPDAIDDEHVIAESGYKKHQKFGTSHKRSVNKRVNHPPPSDEEEEEEESADDQDQMMIIHPSSVEDMEQLLVTRLRENAEIINSIVERSGSNQSENRLGDIKNMDDHDIDSTRLNGDELIARLGNLTDTLDKLHDLILTCRR